MRQLRTSAFTLVELLVVILITATIGSVVIAGFMGGMRAYNRVHDFGQNETDVYIAFEMLERDLNNVVRLRGVPFEGDSTIMQFAALKVIPAADDTKGDISIIRYWYSPQSGVIRSASELGEDTVSSTDEESITSRRLSMQFAYSGMGDGGESGWSDIWQSGSNFPQQVRMRFEIDGDGGKSLERIIVLPLGGRGANEDE